MIRRSDRPHRLSRPAFLAVLLGAAVLPLAPTLAGPEDPDANVERREIVITPSAPHAENTSSDVREEDRTGLRLDVREPVRVEKDVVITRDGRSLTVTGDAVAFSDSDDLAAPSVIVDPRTGNRIEVRGKSFHLVSGSELEQARAAVERARADLAVAQKRLEMLETSVGGADDRTPKSTDNVKTKLGIIASRRKPTEAREKGVTLKGELKGDATGAAMKGADADPEPRIRQLEEKLEKIDALLSEIRDQSKLEGNLRHELKAEPSQGLQVK